MTSTNAKLETARNLIQDKVDAGELVRLTGGRIVEAAEYDPAVHGPTEEEADARSVVAEQVAESHEYQVNPR